MSETWVNSWVPSACAWTYWQKNSKKGNRREQEGTRMGPGGIGMCRSNQNVWLSGSWVLHSLSQVKQFCHLVYFSSSQKPSEGWRWAVVICGTTNSFSRGKKFLFCDVSFKKLLNSVFKKKLIRQDIKNFFLCWTWQGLYGTPFRKSWSGKLILTARRWRSKQNKTVKWSFIYLFYHFSCRKDQLTVFNWKFGSQYFTDPDPLKIRRTLNGLSLWFCLHKCFLNKINKRKNIYLNKFSQYFGLKTYLPHWLKEKWR